MNILVIGSGMYVTGRGRGNPTVLAALMQCRNDGMRVNNLTVLGRTESAAEEVTQAVQVVHGLIGGNNTVSCRAIGSRTLREAIKEECESGSIHCAVVVLPDNLHAEAIDTLLDCNAHVMVVKPFVDCLEQGKALTRKQENAGLVGMVEFHKRFDESNLYLKRMINSGELGVISSIQVNFTQRREIPLEVFSGWSSSTNIFQYLGVHYVDLIHHLTDYRPVSVSASGCRGILNANSSDSLDSVHAIIKWQSPESPERQFVSVLNIGWADPDSTAAMSDQWIRVNAEKGRITCDQMHRGIVEELHTQKFREVNPYFSEFLPLPSGECRYRGYALESFKHFVNAVADSTAGTTSAVSYNTTLPTFRSSLVSTATNEAVATSLASHGAWTRIDEDY